MLYTVTMPIKYKVNCKACQLSKANPKVRARIYKARFNREDGDETLEQVGQDVGLTGASIYNHARKHIKLTVFSDEAEAVRTAKKVARVQAQVNKDLEVGFERGDIGITDEYEVSLNNYLSQGKDILDKGGMKITEKGFLTAIKIKSDIQAKKRGQDIEIMKAVYSFSSGADKEIKDKSEKAKEQLSDNTTTQDAGSPDSGEARPDSFYRELAGNAPA